MCKHRLALVGWCVLTLGLQAGGCAAPTETKAKFPQATAAAYAQQRQTKGVMLLDVCWDRLWNCGEFENAQLLDLSFDRVTAEPRDDARPADLKLAGPGGLAAKRGFVTYALLLEPGEYALSGYTIKAAQPCPRFSVVRITAKRSVLQANNHARGGTFTVAAGETVYIGNFYLDCYEGPMLWRYYTETRDGFQMHLGQYQQRYPFLDLSAVRYRLFRTSALGKPFELQ